MHISAGIYKGLPITAPKGPATRPTAAKVREAVMDMLGPDLTGCHMLDLFAGSGGIGMEALSRGCRHVTFVENSPRALKCLAKNIAALQKRAQGFADVSVVKRNATKLKSNERQYDIIWSDPPYDSALKLNEELRPTVKSILADNGRLILECSKHDVDQMKMMFTCDNGWTLIKDRKYGDTCVIIFQSNKEREAHR